MSNLTEKLLELIKEEKTINEIAEELKLSHKTIYNLLTVIKNKGFEFERKYYYDGNTVLFPKTTIFSNEKQNEVNIITRPSDTEFMALAISDLHLGCCLDRIDLLDKIYDYAKKEDIHIILIAGDIIDGMIGKTPKKHQTYDEQIRYALKNYPFDKNILNFAVLGNHDIDSLRKGGQDFSNVLKSYRQDIVPVGYEIAKINIKNDFFYLKHPLIVPTDAYKMQPNYNDLVLRGHYHWMKLILDGHYILDIPSLCDMTLSEDKIATGAVKMKLKMINGVFCHAHFEQLLITDKVYSVNEINTNFKGIDTSPKKRIELEEPPVVKKLAMN